MAKRWNLILPFVIAIVVIVVIIIKRDSLGEFAATLASVQVLPFVVAFCCLFGRYFLHAFAYKGLFRCVDEEIPYLHIVPLVFSVTFANDCAPTAGTAGSVLIAAWAHKQGMPMGKSVSIVFLEKIGFYGGFAVVMIIGFVILLFTGQMQWYLWLACLAMIMMLAFVCIVLVLGHSHEQKLIALFNWLEGAANWVLRKLHKKEAKPWAERTAASFHEAAVLAANRPKLIVSTFVRFVLAHACDCCCFIFTGVAFGFIQVPYLIAGYVAGFVIATFILQTVGAVEILLALILGGYGAPEGAAAAIALCYRGLIFWVPFLIGAICINFTGSAKIEGSEQVKAIEALSENTVGGEPIVTTKELLADSLESTSPSNSSKEAGH